MSRGGVRFRRYQVLGRIKHFSVRFRRAKSSAKITKSKSGLDRHCCVGFYTFGLGLTLLGWVLYCWVGFETAGRV